MGEKTSLGLQENIEGLLCYVLGLVTGLIFLVLEKENKFVKFHALQCIFMSLVGILVPVLMIIPILGWIAAPILGLVMFVLWVICMIKAFQGQMFKVPVIGDLVEKQL